MEIKPGTCSDVAGEAEQTSEDGIGVISADTVDTQVDGMELTVEGC